jgi:hypothetical protein
VALKLGDALDFLSSMQIKNVILRTDGTIDLGKDGVIVCGPFDDPIPVGPTPFVLTNHKISYSPALRKGTLETDMVPTADAAGGGAPVRFHLEIDLSLPLKEVVVKGTVFVAEDSIGQVTGTITREAIDITLTIPAPGGQGPPVDGLVKGKVKLHLDRDGLSGQGGLLFFQGLQATAQSPVTLLLVHRTEELADSAYPPANTMVMTPKKLAELHGRLRAFAAALAGKAPESWTASDVGKLLASHRLDAGSVRTAYCVPAKQ